LLLSYVNLFKELLFLFASCFAPHLSRLLETPLLFESGCKGIAFLQTAKTFEEKSWNFTPVLTVVCN
ncbi:hypothetical protein, partial [Leyella stercorea]|uniref:hypothetical protein n=1 Tax=Leyella stercorea TaxID=363265 RepID=UPI00242F521B